MKTRDLTLISLSIALLIICSQLAFNIGPVPLTLQTLAVLLIAFNLKPVQALIATSLYTFMGLVGLPVFANWSGGVQTILSPTFGFILSFIVASYVASSLVHRYAKRTWQHYFVAATIATILIYAIGMIYFAGIMNFYKGANMPFSQIIALTMLPFIPGDIIKAMLAVIVSQRLPQR
ncbi:biotin transporter BioY [Aerococcaceae bacterium NML191292]|nr:biotin transporter BioY [Aerococcaceae bacterium NML191292]